MNTTSNTYPLSGGFALTVRSQYPTGRPATTVNAIVHPSGAEIGTISATSTRLAEYFVAAFVDEFGADVVPSEYDLKTWQHR